MNTLLVIIQDMQWTTWLSGMLIFTGTMVLAKNYGVGGRARKRLPFDDVRKVLSRVVKAPGRLMGAGSTRVDGHVSGPRQSPMQSRHVTLEGNMLCQAADQTHRLSSIIDSAVDRTVEASRYQESARAQLESVEYSIKRIMDEISQVMRLPDGPSLPESKSEYTDTIASPVAAIAA